MERQLEVGDVVEFAPNLGGGYEPGPYIISRCWFVNTGPMVQMTKMDESPVYFAFHAGGEPTMLHQGVPEDFLKKLDFLSAVRKRRHGK